MLSEKQKSLIGFANDQGTVSLSVGVIRSGKSYAAAIGFMLHTQRLEDPYTHLILGKKLRVLETELLPTMQEMAANIGAGYRYSRSDQILNIGDQKYIVAAGNDERSQDRVQGITAHSAIIDEATLVPEGFWQAAVSRMTYQDLSLIHI